MIEVGVGDVGARVGTGDGVRVGTGVKVGVATGACVGATVGAAIGGAGAGESEAGGGASVAGAARGGATVGSLPVGVVWLPWTAPSDGAGDEVTFGTAFVFGVALAAGGELLGAVIGPCRGGAPPAEEKTIKPPISSPTTPPARPSRNWRTPLTSLILEFVALRRHSVGHYSRVTSRSVGVTPA